VSAVGSMSDTGWLLRLDDVEAGYGQAASVVRGVSLGFAAGSVTTIIGPNGAGKSTLFKAIAGLIPLRRGDLLLGQTSITGKPAATRVRDGISMCAQGRANFPQLTVAENMTLAGYWLPRPERRARLAVLRRGDEVTDRRWHDRVGRLSGGQQQSVEISMALVSQPRVLLLDEPSLGLAPGARAKVFERVREIARSGVCVVIIEQNVRDAAQISDRFVVLDQGVVALDGPPEAILGDEELRTIYVGRALPTSRATSAGLGSAPLVVRESGLDLDLPYGLSAGPPAGPAQ
jgi:branched-chain amino acid transport system ATP-binding protein